jgi:hypothetical protein
MPETHRKPKSRHEMTLSEAANHGLLVRLRCTLCRRTTYYLAADLLAVYGDQPLFDFRLKCSRDRTAEFVHANYRWPEPGDWGHLPIRRPGRIVTTQMWHTVRLGDEVTGRSRMNHRPAPAEIGMKPGAPSGVSLDEPTPRQENAMADRPPPPGPPPANLKQQTQDAAFLEREFDMAPDEAAELVARDGVDPQALKHRIVDREGQPALPDPLAGKPTPSGPATEFTADTDEQARKPVLHTRNDRRGGG